MQPDPNAGEDGNYFIRSIYFDSMGYKAMEDKINGIDNRRKYRIRFYNGNAEECYLECKKKKRTRIEKSSVEIYREEAEAFLEGRMFFPEDIPPEPFGELLALQKRENYRPTIIVDYLREAYIYPASNVRITFDKEIAAGKPKDCLGHGRFLANILPPGFMVLEVKYDDFLPKHISAAISSVRPVREAASKYVMCLEKGRRGQLL